jgi:hypothetical protein
VSLVGLEVLFTCDGRRRRLGSITSSVNDWPFLASSPLRRLTDDRRTESILIKITKAICVSRSARGQSGALLRSKPTGKHLAGSTLTPLLLQSIIHFKLLDEQLDCQLVRQTLLVIHGCCCVVLGRTVNARGRKAWEREKGKGVGAEE